MLSRASHFWGVQTVAVDTNGAGDSFATAYMVALALRDPHPGATANWAASRTVLSPQVLASTPFLQHSCRLRFFPPRTSQAGVRSSIHVLAFAGE